MAKLPSSKVLLAPERAKIEAEAAKMERRCSGRETLFALRRQLRARVAQQSPDPENVQFAARLRLYELAAHRRTLRRQLRTDAIKRGLAELDAALRDCRELVELEDSLFAPGRLAAFVARKRQQAVAVVHKFLISFFRSGLVIVPDERSGKYHLANPANPGKFERDDRGVITVKWKNGTPDGTPVVDTAPAEAIFRLVNESKGDVEDAWLRELASALVIWPDADGALFISSEAAGGPAKKAAAVLGSIFEVNPRTIFRTRKKAQSSAQLTAVNRRHRR